MAKSSSAAKLVAIEFLRVSANRLQLVPFDQITKRPEYPEQPDVDRNIPRELVEYTFTLMKDTRANSDIRVGIQCFRPSRFGVSQMCADGFVVSPNGEVRQLTEQGVWDLT